jgi:hypothetical protein
MSKIQEVVDYVNERKRLSENLMKIYEVQRLIDGNEVCFLVFACLLVGVCSSVLCNNGRAYGHSLPCTPFFTS